MKQTNKQNKQMKQQKQQKKVLDKCYNRKYESFHF